jgi:hypothetical protein
VEILQIPKPHAPGSGQILAKLKVGLIGSTRLRAPSSTPSAFEVDKQDALRRSDNMDTTEFWELVAQTRELSGSDAFKQANFLIEALAQLPEESIVGYDSILHDLIEQAYIVDLWEAAVIVGCGCSDDGFEYFRAWLVSQGKNVFENALSDPQSLADVIEVGQETQIDTFLYVAPYAYEKATGKGELPPTIRDHSTLKGEASPNMQVLLGRFPTLTAKYWKRCEEGYF